MGFNLKNPLIAGSSGLTSKLDSLLDLQRQGVAAVVLKSLFEEDLVQQRLSAAGTSVEQDYPFKRKRLDEYLQLVDSAKHSLNIPVIASMNCVSAHEWTRFAREIASAGADALELNMYILPSDPMKSSEENENLYFEILTEVRKQVKIPLAVKIGPYFAGMTKMALKLSWTGIAGMVIFNRYYSPDIDIEEKKVVPGRIFSIPEELGTSLRWVALLSDRVMCDIAGARGVHDYSGIVKMMLAGARAVQISSVLYQHGTGCIPLMLEGLSGWMERHGYENTAGFKGLLSLKKTENPADYERFQYLNAYSAEL